MALVGLSLAASTCTLNFAIIGFALTGIGYAIVITLVRMSAATDPAMCVGPAIASVATVGYCGKLLGPPVMGSIAPASGCRVSFAPLAVLALLVVCLALHLPIDVRLR